MHPFLRPLPASSPWRVAIACSDANSLADPTETNVVDTVTLGALEGTPIAVPSGYNISTGAVRTDQSVDFEFAYNVRRLADGTYQRVFLPRAALGSDRPARPTPGSSRSDRDLRRDHPRAQQRLHGRLRRRRSQVGERYVVRSRVVCTSPRRAALRQARDPQLPGQHRHLPGADRLELRVSRTCSPGLPDN